MEIRLFLVMMINLTMSPNVNYNNIENDPKFHGAVSQTVYVNFINGSNDALCGSKTQPCKHLQTAVVKSNVTEVFITGTIQLNKTVIIKRSLIIRGGKHAAIQGVMMEKKVVFGLSMSGGVNLNITDIHFTDVGVVEIGGSSKVFISNCFITGNVNKVFQIPDRLPTFSLTCLNTTFIDIKGHVIRETNYKKVKRNALIIFAHCTLRNISGNGISIGSLWSLTITHCSFSNLCGGTQQYSIYSDKVISNSTPSDTHKRYSVNIAASHLPTATNHHNYIFGKERADSECYIDSVIFVGYISTMHLRHSIFKNNNLGEGFLLWVRDTYDIGFHPIISIENCNFTHNNGSVVGVEGNRNIHLNLRHNIFKNNTVGLFALLNVFDNEFDEFHRISIEDCNFTHNNGTVLEVGRGGSITLNGCQFIENSSWYGLKLIVRLVGMKGISIKQCHFTSIKSECILYICQTETISINNCSFINNQGRSIATFLDCKNIAIDQSYFYNNIFMRRGVVYVGVMSDFRPASIANAHITNTNFFNNSAVELAHNIYTVGHLTLKNVTISSAYDLHSLNEIVSQSGNFAAEDVTLNVHASHTSPINRGVYVVAPKITKLSSLNFYCPINFNVDLFLNQETPYSQVFNSLSLRCVLCNPGTYSLQNGRVKIPKLPTKYDDVNKYVYILINKGKVKCMDCPIGGNCADGQLEASPNFWGYRKSNHVTFTPCPIAYCCSSDTTPCISYDTCNVGRKGVLCGSCHDEYRLNFFNNSCIKKIGKCSDGLFICYTCVYSLSMTLFFAYVTNITSVMKRVWVHLRRKIKCCKHEGTAVSQHNDVHTNLPKIVILQLFVFYYQLAHLLHVKVERQSSKNEYLEGVKANITNFFYFRFIVHIHENVCPTTDITYLQKTAITSLFHLSTVTNLLLLYIVERIVTLLKRKTKITSWFRCMILNRLLFYCRFQTPSCLWIRRNICTPLSSWLTDRVSSLFSRLPVWRQAQEDEYDENQENQRQDIRQESINKDHEQILDKAYIESDANTIEHRNASKYPEGSDHQNKETKVEAHKESKEPQKLKNVADKKYTENVEKQSYIEKTRTFENHKKSSEKQDIRAKANDQEYQNKGFTKEEYRERRKQSKGNINEIIENGREDQEIKDSKSQREQQEVPESSKKLRQKEIINKEENEVNIRNRKLENEEDEDTINDAIVLFQPHSMSDIELCLAEVQDTALDKESIAHNIVYPVTFTSRLKLTFIKLLSAIYTPVTYCCFKLIFCTSIDETWHLYVYGDLICYTWWQNIILIIVIPGLIVFPLTFGMSLSMIQRRQITTTQFLVAAGVPYYAIYLYLRTFFTPLPPCSYSLEEDLFVWEIKMSYKEVFRPSSQLMSWPVVQLYRNFIVAAVKTFVIDPMYRSLTFLPIFCIFFVHDRSAKPFLNKSINVLQTSSTVFLTMIVICNMIFSFSLYMINIDTIPHMNTVLTVLSYVESIVYFIFPLMLPISILWRKYIVKKKND